LFKENPGVERERRELREKTGTPWNESAAR